MSQVATNEEQPELESNPNHIGKRKIHTSYINNPDFVPPKDFVFLPTLKEVPINLKGQTEIPFDTQIDYTKPEYQYRDFLPHVTLTSEPALAPYEHVDVASRADPEKKALFAAIPHRKDMTPNIGTEVRGVQLSQLTDKQKDELALYTAERGIVVFRDQDFVDKGIEWLKEFGSYLDGTEFDTHYDGDLNTIAWHSDMSYEVNPPCTTFLSLLAGPECGGDTLFVNCMTAYDRLSPPMQQFLEGISAVHSGQTQALRLIDSHLARRPTIDTVHPVVRKHPVTGRKALWVNNNHKAELWEKGTVTVYDNRMVQHSVTLDYALDNDVIRHVFRLTPQRERPAL
ncbi:TauD-domain-containing protein [Cucurbitaria berberidis CBS 394.84]|uniref:TauD-domain-containing protein n=1 Tax=Cucurbitaria berberidis CBS 394.84 TaxID=1168544 RepID=A0A9P4GQW8_9PLEO|nr:TauD-domain-containing protein [Cucurbitaria berberidis CBS 394.84]KAF1850142.1 TauD-domain-containing protein [Cucurbitaria berberidis CBS 394.84]